MISTWYYQSTTYSYPRRVTVDQGTYHNTQLGAKPAHKASVAQHNQHLDISPSHLMIVHKLMCVEITNW